MPNELEDARRAKSKARGLLGGKVDIKGIGLTTVEGRFAVKVNISEPMPTKLPSRIDGVKLVYEVVGDVRKF